MVSLKGRAGHTATVVGKDIYILGGRNGNEFFNDMWVFDTEAEQWKLLQSKTPFSPRAYHTCTLVNDQELWVIGGSDPKTMHSDVHVFDTVSLEWSNPSTPSMKPRGTHSAVLHPAKKNAILIYGGYGGSKSSCWLNDLIVFQTDTLDCEDLKPEGARPLGRGYHTLTAFGTCVALFGGKAEGGIINEDTLSIYDAVANKWSMVPVKGESPSPRSNHAATLANAGMIIIHGGRHGSLRLNDFYILKVPSVCSDAANLDLKWHMIDRSDSSPTAKKTSRKRSVEAAKTDSPIGRSAHSLVAHNQALYMFGGYGGEGLTFADLFVLRKLPKFAELEVRKRKMAGQLLMEVTDSIEERGEEKKDKGWGWRNTKHPKPHSEKQADRWDDSGALNAQSNRLHQKVDAAEFCKEKPETRSTEPLKVHETKGVSSFEDRSLALLVQERDLYKKEVRSLQQSVETLQATINNKSMVDLDYQQKLVQLEQELQRFQNENLQQQSAMKEMEKEVTNQSKKVRKLEQENKSLKADVQNAKSSLEETENARKTEALKMNDLQTKLQNTCKSIEGSKAAAAEATVERDKYKTCVQALEAELQKQMDALRQVTLRFEGEKAFLLKEVSERKSTADKLLTELGTLKECVRSLEDKNNCQLKQLEQESDKLAMLQKEKEAIACSKAVLESENKQLVEMKQAAEENCTLLRSELQASRISTEQFEAEIARLKERAEQNQKHASELHESLKKTEENYNLQIEENRKICSLLRETEEFEQAQVRSMQAHTEKLRCTRQSCSY
ncbi:hypothetical protein GOP47_0007622 [Adiantum capillus-veneris]|uniref:Attractin/MKLN-like beta-propeller domain-containing protein n=1 Tax=Adiantum capillus-veneris TaxID=13818 RepID=A0A9D4ZJE3_ADICA|nr:hypothetical protein GOP47_0007622 [Adiantum capillus-veneris]